MKTLGKLNDKFYNPSVGAWGRYYSGLDYLNELSKKDAASAGKRVGSLSDKESVTVVQGILMAKKDCQIISKEYWATVARVEAVRKKVDALKKTCDAAISKKSKKVTKSSSIDALHDLSKKLDIYSNEIGLACMGGPHKPDHRLLK
ncbi:MAG: hypothetical protein ABJH45_09330 [Paracoccaceae bacterium]